MTPLLSASQELTIQFYDVDPMNVAWHGNYFRFFEAARCKLMDLIQYNYKEMEESGYLWPFVDFKIKYIHPLTLQQKVRIQADLEEYENRLKISYRIYCSSTDQLLTKATSIQVAVQAGSQELQFESPPILLNKVREALS
jgi:acyl-CoA thioester hydrolase